MFYSIASIAPIASELRSSGRKLVLATGFFDLLHAEHLNFLAKAKAQGDVLIVAVESDQRARETKGEGRPIETQVLRASKVAAIADYVIVLPSDFNNFEAYDSLISAVRPAVYAVSSHTAHLKSKSFLIEKYGGTLAIVHDWNPAISTTKIIQNSNI